ncbi:uncharacterized protein LOC130797558 [Amaranthus tricolor]|uniref:uncharacterized protein LOC130797558 n=1 Tax=Amaranthus tricolor TaxID=29722 RepID=UPI0025851EE4|nr:uncharacterized protein LOC130797558 [Amaranthus tricolor]
MALPKSFLVVLVIVLGFSSIIKANAVPSTRAKRLMHDNLANVKASMSFYKGGIEALMHDEGEIMERKMREIEVQDYPGSGANNRHTPRPQFSGCVDC